MTKREEKTGEQTVGQSKVSLAEKLQEPLPSTCSSFTPAEKAWGLSEKGARAGRGNKISLPRQVLVCVRVCGRVCVCVAHSARRPLDRKLIYIPLSSGARQLEVLGRKRPHEKEGRQKTRSIVGWHTCAGKLTKRRACHPALPVDY